MFCAGSYRDCQQRSQAEVVTSEVNNVYLSACTAVQKEFGNDIVLRPAIALVLGADKSAVNFDKKSHCQH